MERKIKTLIKNYYLPHNQLHLEKLWRTSPKKLTQKDKQYIKQLQPKFKELIILRNQLAKLHGFDNFFNYIAGRDKIPKNKIKLFFSNVHKLGKKLTKQLPKDVKKSEWFDDYYTLNLNYLASQEYNLPTDIKNFLLKQNSTNQKYIDKIKLVHSSNDTLETKYDYKNKTATIYFDKKATDITTAELLAHEYGHALGMVKKSIAGKEKEEPDNYIDEKRAIKMELKFTETLNNHDKKIAHFSRLHYFAYTLFESKIYQNPNLNFAQTYTNSFQEVTGNKTHGKPDYYYLLDSFLIFAPCYSTLYSIIYADFYTKKL